MDAPLPDSVDDASFAIAFISGLVIIGGIKRIGNVTSKLAPFMAALYVAAALLIIFANSFKYL